MNTLPSEIVIAQTREWLEKAVIGLNLCPFAKAVHLKKQIRYKVSSAVTEDTLILDLHNELEYLELVDAKVTDTTLLIHPGCLNDFYDYNEFIKVAERSLKKKGKEGVFQIASFHPLYKFSSKSVDDITNFTNRSPYPLLHILREASLTSAIDSYDDIEGISERNLQTLTELGLEGWNKL